MKSLYIAVVGLGCVLAGSGITYAYLKPQLRPDLNQTQARLIESMGKSQSSEFDDVANGYLIQTGSLNASILDKVANSASEPNLRALAAKQLIDQREALDALDAYAAARATATK